MSTATVPTTPAAATPQSGTHRAAVNHRPIPFTRLLSVELQKMFDTRSGLWLMIGIAGLAAIATGAVVLFSGDQTPTHDDYAAAIGIPMQIILPIIAILAVTSEWSQRTGLATFTMVPHRSRIIMAKLIVSIGVGLVAIPTALGIGAIGNLVAAGIDGTDAVWNVSLYDGVLITFSTTLIMLLGFSLGALFRNSAAGIVGFFVWFAVLPGLFALLANAQDWFADLQPWVDFQFAMGPLYEGGPTGDEWLHLATASVPWLILPLAVGMWFVHRSEPK